ncbi:DUF2922 domain-containing protein [Texcoconibacillus texcoconensis]|uniref:DUF2922 domain-containing protein n=1 Tax=Texcoconibacillus texcoconensis TaxID=1095777 RepID=A0A840QSS1_9BACI|nr:DUF2922 domain-containing protein [Texcoconibacillus texcoconensis]MBB5174358.1 hypothetical protein [Texcoconibacillus texcoconensis]
MSKRIRLQFKNEEDRTVSLSIHDPRQDLEAEEVSEVMDDLINLDVFYSTGGKLVKKHNASIIERQVDTIDID